VICSEFLLHLDDLLDNAVDPTLRAALQAHLGDCEHCTITVTTTRKTIEVYRSNVLYDLPDALRDRLQAAILAKCKKC
jgi:anti-sigma factor RsiW